MSNPQIENGYTRLANELMDAIIAFDFSKRQYKILLSVIRKTYGYGKKTDDISTRQVAEMTGIDQGHCVRTINELCEMKVMLKQHGQYGQVLEINKHFDKWTRCQNSITPQGDAKTASEVMPKQHRTRCQNSIYKRQPQKTIPKERPRRGNGDAKTASPDLSAELWQIAKAMGITGNLLGMLARDHGKEKLGEAIGKMIAAKPVDPKSYLCGLLRKSDPDDAIFERGI